MKWKEVRELLYPTKGKIIIFLVLFLIFVPVVEYDTGIRCIIAPCPSGAPGSILSYLLGSYKTVYQVYCASIVIGAVAAYAIACLLLSLAKNVKK